MSLHIRISPLTIICLFLLVLLSPPAATAQLGGSHLHGFSGLTSGTQGPPGLYAGYLFYDYRFDRVQTLNGTELRAPEIDIIAHVLATNVVTNKKFFGGHWAFSLVVPVFNSRLSEPTFNLNTSNWGFSDLYVQPIQLGWHFKHADMAAGYAFYAPTGRFVAGALDNTGLGQWANEFSLGTTLRAGPLNLATTAFYELNSSRRDQDLKIGDILTLEGGLGVSFFKGFGNIGAAYYAQWKTTEDTGSALNPLSDGKKGSLVGVGPELVMPLGKLPILTNFRYLFDVRSRFAPTGDTIVFGITYVLPIHPPKK